MNKHFLIFCLLFTSCLSSKYDFNSVSKKNSFISQTQSEIDSIVQQVMNKYKIPGLSIGIVNTDSIVYTNGYGVNNVKDQEAISANSLFHTASISKLFTAHAIINLIEEGKLNLDDKVINIIPQIKSDDDRFKYVTIENLLNHTSGIPDIKNYGWRKNNQSKNDLKMYILSQNFKLKSNPSQSFNYSNLGYDLLGFIVERVSGVPFEEYVKSSILLKNNMQKSDFRYFLIDDSLKVSPHSQRIISNKIHIRKNYPYTREHSPSSTLNSSSKELCFWMNYILNELNEKGNESIIYKMTQPSSNLNNHIGLGFQLFNIESFKAIGHYGGDKGFRSYLFMIPEKKIGLVLLANCDYNENFREEILHTISKLFLP